MQKSEIKDYELQLTDGWYSCPARVDPPMVRLIDKGKIQVGTKLVTQGAILANCDEGISPLEVSDLLFLPQTKGHSLIRMRNKSSHNKLYQTFLFTFMQLILVPKV